MNFIADESGRLVDKVDPIAETVFKIDLVSRGYGYAICDYDHCDTLSGRSFKFMHVTKHTTRNADRQHGQFADGLVLDATRDIDNNARMQFDFVLI